MQIFRHCYSDSEWFNGNHPFYYDLASFGFCNRDGTELSDQDFNNNNPQLRWRLDNQNNNYFSFNSATGKSYHDFYYSYFYMSNGEAYCLGNATITKRYMHVVFLPLINNGFLTFFGLNGAQYTAGQEYPAALFNFSNTPNIYATNQHIRMITLNIIGLPPSNTLANWIYFFSNPTITMSGTLPVIDFGNQNVRRAPYLSGWTDISAYAPPNYANTYTNINKNVCSLIKMPYNTNYINGVYLLATSPQPLKECTFFSFNGRNFINLIANYVFELAPTI